MSKDGKSIYPDHIVQAEASAWIAQLESGNMSKAERHEFEQWMKRSPSHEAAVKELAGLWEELDSLAVMQPAMDDVIKQRRKTRRSIGVGRVFRPAGIAAMAAVLIAAGAISFYGGLFSEQDRSEQLVVATAIGEAKEVELSDGSFVDVNTASNMQVNFSNDERSVHLTNGEAVFSVAHEEDRPFIVHAGQHRVRAIGTVFSVRLEDGEVDVIVTEGRVEITPASVPQSAVAETGIETSPAAVLVKGQSATATVQGVALVEAVDLQRVEQRLAWREGVLDFSGETLDYAVDEFMRYTPYKIAIDGDELSQRRVGGVFRIDDADQFIEVLEANFDIVAIQISDDEFLLKMASVN